MTGSGGNIYVDGALVYDIRVPFGYWEAKDSKDDLDEEIRKKEAKGYPKTNIIYEDTQRADPDPGRHARPGSRMCAIRTRFMRC